MAGRHPEAGVWASSVDKIRAVAVVARECVASSHLGHTSWGVRYPSRLPSSASTTRRMLPLLDRQRHPRVTRQLALLQRHLRQSRSAVARTWLDGAKRRAAKTAETQADVLVRALGARSLSPLVAWGPTAVATPNARTSITSHWETYCDSSCDRHFLITTRE